MDGGAEAFEKQDFQESSTGFRDLRSCEIRFSDLGLRKHKIYIQNDYGILFRHG